MKKVFAEIGFGNETFFSTEFEEGESEYRVQKFLWPKKVKEVYCRLWLGKKVYIFSSLDGFKIKHKDRSKLKILIGLGGEGE